MGGVGGGGQGEQVFGEGEKIKLFKNLTSIYLLS